MDSLQIRLRRWALIGSIVAMLVNATTLSAAELGEEVGFGNYRDRQEISTRIFVLDEALNRKVSALGDRLAKAAGRPDLTYTFRIVNDPSIQARAHLGRVCVYPYRPAGDL
ncbi:MAG: hypothetical protein AB7G75_11010 [Candidatus Binatia bacterium]